MSGGRADLGARDRDLISVGALFHRGSGVWADLTCPKELAKAFSYQEAGEPLKVAADSLRVAVARGVVDDVALLSYPPASWEARKHSPPPHGIVELVEMMDREGFRKPPAWVAEVTGEVFSWRKLTDELKEVAGSTRLFVMEVLRQRTGPDRSPIRDWTEKRWTSSSRAHYVQDVSSKTVREALLTRPLPKLRSALHRTGTLRAEARRKGIDPAAGFVSGRLVGEGVTSSLDTAEELHILSEALDEAPGLLDQAAGWVLEHISEPLSATTIAYGVGVSESRLRAVVKEQTGLGVRQWATRERIWAACKELVGTRDPINEVRVRCGIANHTAFRRNFVGYTGMLPKDFRKKYGPTTNPKIEQALHWSRMNLHENITPYDIAGQAGYSPQMLDAEVKKHTGKPPAEWLAGERIELAKKLFEEAAEDGRRVDVEEVARECGMPARSTFQRQFHKFVGMSPRQYRKRTLEASPIIPATGAAGGCQGRREAAISKKTKD